MQTSIDVELNSFLLRLSSDQKKSLLSLLKKTLENDSNIHLMEYNQDLDDAENEHDVEHVSNSQMKKNVLLWNSK